MRESTMIRSLLGWFLGIAAGAALATSASAMQPNPPKEAPESAQVAVKAWESAETRLMPLLEKGSALARKGIERALAANREGRQNAAAALQRGDEERAMRALEIASAHAEIGFNQARASLEESLLPQLEAAASEMSMRHAPSVPGLVAAPTVEIDPTRR